MLIGNLTRDPELRYTPSGVAVCNFGLATNRRWNDSEGNLQESTEFHRLVAWGKLAELCSQLLFKGRKVFVEGRLQTREWSAQDGTKRTSTEVVVDNMLVLDSRRREEAVSTAADEPALEPAPGPSGQPLAQEDSVAAVPSATGAKPIADHKKKKKTVDEPEEKTETVNKDDIPF